MRAGTAAGGAAAPTCSNSCTAAERCCGVAVTCWLACSVCSTCSTSVAIWGTQRSCDPLLSCTPPAASDAAPYDRLDREARGAGKCRDAECQSQIDELVGYCNAQGPCTRECTGGSWVLCSFQVHIWPLAALPHSQGHLARLPLHPATPPSLPNRTTAMGKRRARTVAQGGPTRSSKRLKDAQGRPQAPLRPKSVWQDPEHPILESIFEQLLAQSSGKRWVSGERGAPVGTGWALARAAAASCVQGRGRAATRRDAAPHARPCAGPRRQPRLLLLAGGGTGRAAGRHGDVAAGEVGGRAGRRGGTLRRGAALPAPAARLFAHPSPLSPCLCPAALDWCPQLLRLSQAAHAHGTQPGVHQALRYRADPGRGGAGGQQLHRCCFCCCCLCCVAGEVQAGAGGRAAPRLTSRVG